MTELPDGTVIHPHRGFAPRPRAGYEALDGDPFTHVPILYPCKYRTEVQPECNGCGGGVLRRRCYLVRTIDGVPITRIDCKKCDKREEPDS